MNKKPKNPFRIKNGVRFSRALQKAAYGDANINKMFIDNVQSIGIGIDITPLIEKGKFREALVWAFKWDDTNEKKDFWLDIHKNLRDAE